MAKKIVNNVEHPFSLFNSIGGIIGTIITIVTLAFSVGWAFGSWRTSNEYEKKIHDLKFEKLQMELEFQKKLQEEKEKWSNEQNQKISLQEVSLFIQNLNDYQKSRK